MGDFIKLLFDIEHSVTISFLIILIKQMPSSSQILFLVTRAQIPVKPMNQNKLRTARWLLSVLAKLRLFILTGNTVFISGLGVKKCWIHTESTHWAISVTGQGTPGLTAIGGAALGS